MYVMGWLGNTHNEFRESDRKFYGVDARVTNQSFDGLTSTVYGKSHVQNNSADTMSLNSRYPGNPYFLEPRPPQTMYTPNDNYLGLVDRHWTTIGWKNRWRPFYDSYGIAKGFAVVGGYEWAQIKRSNVTYELDNLALHATDHRQQHAVRGRAGGLVACAEFVPALPIHCQFVADRRCHRTGTAECRRGHQLESARVRRPSGNGRHLERGRRFHAQRHILGRKQLQPLGICQLLGDGVSVHTQCLVHAECQVVARRRLCQSDELDHPGHHAGSRRRSGT